MRAGQRAGEQGGKAGHPRKPALLPGPVSPSNSAVEAGEPGRRRYKGSGG